MKTTTRLLAPLALALATAGCLIELSPSAADPTTTPAPFVRPDASANPHASDASSVDATIEKAALATDAGAPLMDATIDASLTTDATSL